MESDGQFSVVHKIWKLGSWQMCKNKESYRQVGIAFVCSRCSEITKGMVNLIKKLCNEVALVNRFCYLGDRTNAFDCEE